MFVINSNQSNPKILESYYDIGDWAMLPFSFYVYPYTRQQTGSNQTITVSDGTFFTLRGVNFHGYMVPFSDNLGDPYTDTNLGTGRFFTGRWVNTWNNPPNDTNLTVVSNILLNRKLFSNTNLWGAILMNHYLYSGWWSQWGGISWTVTYTLKKVNASGTVTTMKTFSKAFSITATGKIQADWSNALSATVGDDDVVFLEISINYSQFAWFWSGYYYYNGSHGGLGNGKVASLISL